MNTFNRSALFLSFALASQVTLADKDAVKPPPGPYQAFEPSQNRNVETPLVQTPLIEPQNQNAAHAFNSGQPFGPRQWQHNPTPEWVKQRQAEMQQQKPAQPQRPDWATQAPQQWQQPEPPEWVKQRQAEM
ncbi:MAG: hypothetical protein OQL06_14300, partial [Gammaproteobacteria bacterium]|nr:hypothetical protein [Gammaproteobacteria bacterium]